MFLQKHYEIINTKSKASVSKQSVPWEQGANSWNSSFGPKEWDKTIS
jgi:hypothetical protein